MKDNEVIIIKNILVIGSLNMDFVIEVDKMPVPGETIIGKEFSLVPGGKGANKAYALGKLGANVTMLGVVGNDEYGKKLIDNLNSVSVDTRNIEKKDGVNTGCAFINVDKSGENNIVVISGANEDVDIDFINKNKNLIDNADIVIMQLETPIETAIYVSSLVKEKGKMLILDPAPAIPDLSMELLSNVDVLKPNETELQTLTGMEIESKTDVIEAARVLVNKGVKNVIVTLGNKGSILVNKDYVQEFSTYDVKAVDTTAAGDSFIAALAKSLSNDNSIEESIKFAHLVSSIVVTKKGAQTSIPNEKEIEEFKREII